MAHTTRFYVHGTGNAQRSTARRLIADVQIPQHSLNETVELYCAHDVIESETLPGLFYVRSRFSPHRYYTIYREECSCGGIHCRHHKQALAFKNRDLEAMAYTDRLLEAFAFQGRYEKAYRDECNAREYPRREEVYA